MLRLFGKSGNPAEVSDVGALLVSGMDAITLNALTAGDAYVWTAQDTDVDAADTLLAVRNDSHKYKLVIDRIEITNGNVATRYEIHKITAAYTSAGTAGTEINLGGSGKKAPVTCHADETGNTQGTVFQDIGAGVAVEQYSVKVGIVLNEGEAIGVDQVTESTAGACSIYGYFVEA